MILTFKDVYRYVMEYIKNNHIFATTVLFTFWLVLSVPMQSHAVVVSGVPAVETFEYLNDEYEDAVTVQLPEINTNIPEVIEAIPDPSLPSLDIEIAVKPRPVPPPGSSNAAQAYAQTLVSSSEWGCLHALWSKESGWRVDAENSSSGAYGIPQALPGSKMASAGADWETNHVTQVNWGLNYINSRYGSPCKAWEHSQNVGWY